MRLRVVIGYLLGVIAIAGALVAVTGGDVFAQEVQIPAKCNATHCIIPTEALVGMIEAHNAHIDEIARLKKNCGLKVERNS